MDDKKIDLVAHWYSAHHFWGRGPGFESCTSHNDPDVLRGKPTPEAKKKYIKNSETALMSCVL